MNEKKLLHYGFNIEDYITDNIVNEAKENDINFCNELYNTINKYSSSLTQYADELIRITYTAKKYIRVCKEVDDNYISITKPYHKDLANLEEFFLLFEGNDFSIQEIVLKSQNGVVKLKSSILVESISTLLLNILNDSQDITRRKSPQIKILSSRMKARNTVNFMRKVYATELLQLIQQINVFPIENGNRASNEIYNLIGELLILADFIEIDKLESNLSDYVVTLLR